MQATARTTDLGEKLEITHLKSKSKNGLMLVTNTSNNKILGMIKWPPGSRRFCFITYPNVILDSDIMDDVSALLVKMNHEKKKIVRVSE